MAQKIRTQDVMELFAEKLDKAIEKFDSEALEYRSKLLYNLVKEIWDIN